MTGPAVIPAGPSLDELDALFAQYGGGKQSAQSPAAPASTRPALTPTRPTAAGGDDELDSLYRQYGGTESPTPARALVAPSTRSSSASSGSPPRSPSSMDNAMRPRELTRPTPSIDNALTPEALPAPNTEPPGPYADDVKALFAYDAATGRFRSPPPDNSTKSTAQTTTPQTTTPQRPTRQVIAAPSSAPRILGPAQPLQPAQPAQADATASSPTRARGVVAPNDRNTTLPAGPPVALTSDTRATPSEPAPGMSHARALGLDDESFPGRVANALGNMAAHPIKTAAGFVTAPVEAAITLARASAEQDAANALAESGGNPDDVERTVTPKQAAIAAGQIAALGLAGPLGRMASSLTARFLGETASGIVGHAVAGAGAGAAFSPEDPAVGATIGGGLGGAHAVITESSAPTETPAATPALGDRSGVELPLPARSEIQAPTPQRASASPASDRAAGQGKGPAVSPTPPEGNTASKPTPGSTPPPAVPAEGEEPTPIARSASPTPSTTSSELPAAARATGPEAEVPAGARTPTPSYSYRDLIGRSADDIEGIASEEAAREKNIDVELFGEEGAKAYNRAQRIVNSANAALDRTRTDEAQSTIDRMESALTDAQRDRLFGIGESGYNAEELREAARWARAYSPENVGDLPEAYLRNTVGRELTTGNPDRDISSALRLRGAARELARRTGKPLEQIISDGVNERLAGGKLSSAGHAAELLSSRLKALKDAGLFDESIEPATSTRKQIAPAAPPTSRAPIQGAIGRPTRVLLRDGQTLPAEYRVVSADDVRSSHDPFTFLPTAEYPEGVQGRDYQRNTAAQEAVAHRTLGFNTDIALNPSESAGESTPTILPDGTVLAGNERSMLVRRAAVFAPEKYADYVDQLRQRAIHFGVDPAQIDRVESPVLVRVLTDAKDVANNPARWAEINRLSDEVSTKAKSAVEEGAARATKLSQAHTAMDHLASTLEPEQTVAEYLGTANGRAFVQALKTEGVITPEEFGRLTDSRGAVTDEGRSAIRRMLLSTAVSDPSVLLDAPASAAAKLEHAIPAIVSTRGTPFDLAPLTADALRMVAEARDNGMNVRELAGQTSMFGEASGGARDAMTTALADFLETAKPSAVKAAFRRYAVLAREATGNAESGDMFGGTGFNTPADAFADAFKASLSRTAESSSPTAEPSAEAADLRTFFDRIPVEQRDLAGHPTRAGQLLAQGHALRDRSTPREAPAGSAIGAANRADPVTGAARGVNRFTDALRKIFAPASRGEEARLTALAVREHDAALVHRYERAKEALKEFGRQMDKLPARDQLDFIDRLETGRSQRTPELGQVAGTIRKLLDEARDQIRGLGTGQLEHWIENYFPHIWADPERAKNVIASLMSKRSITGPGTFLKKRSIPTIKEGMDRGLVPVTTNPIDLTLFKLREMHRYLAGQRIIGELKENGFLRFVNSFDKAPDGYKLLDDKISTVYGPPKVTVHEAFDHFIRSGLEQVLNELGVEHERRARIGTANGGGIILGAAQGDTKITTRAATDMSVLEHELGHILDARFGLSDELRRYEPQPGEVAPAGTLPSRDASERLAARAKAHSLTIDQELRALANLRHEGVEKVSPSSQEYVQSKEERIANAVMGLLHAPERLREVAPTVDARLRTILARDPVTAKLLDIKPSFRHEVEKFDVGTPGMVVLGHYYAPEPVARVLNNYTSPGLSQSAIGPFFDVYRGAGNLLNMIQLGFSGFHLQFTSLDAAVSRNALGILQGRDAVKRLVGGDVAGAGKRAVEAVASFASSPLAPITTATKGFKVRRAYLRGTADPVMAQIIDGLEAAGGRVKMDEFYGGTAWRQFRLALHEDRYGTAAAKVLPAAIEQSSAWLMQHVVPAQKLGVFYDLAQFELSKLPPGANRTQVRTAMARAWDSVDNRLGQLTYNNLFWHRYLKDAMMASVRSVGWNVGTFRELGGGAADLIKAPSKSNSALEHEQGERFLLTPGASYVIALPATVMLANGVLQLLYTGQVPSGKDWFYPRTGMKNPDGSDERVQPASYLRDVRDVATAPWQTVKNKENPALRLTLDMLNNRDFFGDEIRNPNDPAVTQIKQEARYVLNQAAPIGVTNVRDAIKRGDSPAKAAQNLLGITPAPRAVQRSPAMQRMNELLAAHSGGPRSPEQKEASQERADLMGRLRRGEPGAGSALAGAVQAGEMTSTAAKRTQKASQSPAMVESFKRLTLPEALEVYELANPDERKQLDGALSAKSSRAKPGQYNGADEARIRETMKKLHP